MASTLATLRTRTLALVRDPRSTHWDSTQVDEALRTEWHAIYDRVCDRCPSFFSATETLYTWPANQRYVDLSGAAVLNTTTYNLVSVGTTRQIAAISATNPVVRMTRMGAQQMVSGVVEQYPAEFWENYTGVGGTADGGYYLEGHRLYLNNIPSTNTQIVIQWLAGPPTFPTNTANAVVTDERLARFEPALTHGAALLLLAKDKESSDPLAIQYQRHVENLDGYLERWQRAGEPYFRMNRFGREAM